MTTVWLEQHPPARSQFRVQRRAAVTGAIVVHTAENVTDTVLPDGGAESVARFISNRVDAAGSYHSVVDSDSIVRVGRYEWEMFHEGTGGNRWSLGLSFACRAEQWGRLPAGWTSPAIRNGAREAASMAAWVRAVTGIVVPAQRITPAEYKSGRPGFVGHGELDPGRRVDPGTGFPWTEFLEFFGVERGEDMPFFPNPTFEEVKEIQRSVNDAGYLPALLVDGSLGSKTWAGMVWVVNNGVDDDTPASRIGKAFLGAVDLANKSLGV